MGFPSSGEGPATWSSRLAIGTNCAVEDEDSLGEGLLEFAGKIVRHGLVLRGDFWSDLGASQEQIYKSRYVDGFAFGAQ